MGAVILGEVINDKQIALIATGDDWEVADAAARIKHITPLLKRSDPPGALIGPLTWACVTQLAFTFQGTQHQWTPGPQLEQWITDELIRRTTVPEWSLTTAGWEPMAHQKTGACAIAATGRFYLMDDMGTGKCRSALLGLQLRKAFPAIIVAPASVIDVWLEETEASMPHLKAVAWRGQNRRELIGTADLYVMSYDVMRRDVEAKQLRWLNATAVVYDEAHALVNRSTKQSIAGRKLAHTLPNVICMSGTPITKDVGGFWSALNALDHETWPSRERFKKKFTEEGFAAYGEAIEGLDKDKDAEFRACMLGTMRRVAKEDVLDLPPKTHQRRVVEIPEEYRKAYDEMREDMLAHLPDNDEPLPAMSTLTQLIRLSQLAASACDVDITEEWDEEKDELKQIIKVDMREPSWKVDALMEIMTEHAAGEPVVAFSPFKQLMNLAGKVAAAKGYKVGYITGDIPPVKRKPIRIDFQDGKYDLLCVTTAAGGLGLTLTRAATAVFLSRPWSYVQAKQAEDRLYRKGQERPVQIIDIVARDTVDKRVFLALQGKAESFAQLVQDPRLVRELLS